MSTDRSQLKRRASLACGELWRPVFTNTWAIAVLGALLGDIPASMGSKFSIPAQP